MRIYLAHPITDYGTARQSQAIAALKSHFADLGRPLEIENPDQPHHQSGYASGGMDYFRGVVESCHGVAFMRFPDGSIGAGVGKEIRWGYLNSSRMYEVFGGKVYPLTGDMPTPILSVEDTRATLRQLRESHLESAHV
ncbi:MAG: hypothetical protein ACRER5_00480 [Pseudomonas sp.]